MTTPHRIIAHFLNSEDKKWSEEVRKKRWTYWLNVEETDDKHLREATNSIAIMVREIIEEEG